MNKATLITPDGHKIENVPLTRSGKFQGTQEEWDSEVTPKVSESIQKEIDSLPRYDGTHDAQAQESLCEIKEVNAESVKNFKFRDQHILENERERQGQYMTHQQFIKILRAAGVQCWYNQKPERGIIGLRALAPGKESLGLQYICGVKLGRTTEYDTFHYDERGLPLNKKTIGWRSVLIQLISRGILTERKAHQIFGAPPITLATSLYWRALWQMRNERAQ